MINEISVCAVPTNKRAVYVFSAFLGSSFIFFAVSMMLTNYKGVFATVAMAFIVGAIFIYTKYMAAKYYYDITEGNDGVPLFVVRQTVGKKSTTLCRIEVGTIKSVDRFSRSDKREKPEPGTVRYRYLPTLMPDSYCCLKIVSPYERAEVIIEATEELAGIIREYSLQFAREGIYGEE